MTIHSRYSQLDMQEAYLKLQQQEQPVLTWLGALTGTIPATVTVFLMLSLGGFFLWMLMIPSAIIGAVAAYVGRSWQIATRLPVAIYAGLYHVVVVTFFSFSPLLYLLTPICAFVAFSCAKMPLNHVERLALVAKSAGLLFSPNNRSS
jgi:hypothetical protein